MLREKEEYKNGNYEEALRKTFMDIDKILLDPKTASVSSISFYLTICIVLMTNLTNPILHYH